MQSIVLTSEIQRANEYPKLLTKKHPLGTKCPKIKAAADNEDPPTCGHHGMGRGVSSSVNPGGAGGGLCAGTGGEVLISTLTQLLPLVLTSPTGLPFYSPTLGRQRPSDCALYITVPYPSYTRPPDNTCLLCTSVGSASTSDRMNTHLTDGGELYNTDPGCCSLS